MVFSSDDDDEVVVLDEDSSDSGSDDIGTAKKPASASATSSSLPPRPNSSSAAAAAAAAKSRSTYADSDSDSDDDGLLSSGPTFSQSNSGNDSDAAARLRRTLARLESLESATSTASASSSGGGGSRRKKLTAEERSQLAASKKAAKQREVAARKRARETARVAKARQKELDKVAKKQAILDEKQSSGKFATEEICVWVDKSLAKSGARRDGQEDDVMALLDAARSGSGSARVGGAAANGVDSGDEPPAGLGPRLLHCLKEKNYRTVIEGETALSSNCVDNIAPTRWESPIPGGGRGVGCIRWTRRDHLAGGSAGVASVPSTDDNVQRTEMVVVVFHEPKAFLKLLERDFAAEARDDYPELRAWLGRLRSSLASRWECRWKSTSGKGGRSLPSADSTNGDGSATAAPVSSSRVVLVLHKVQEELRRQWNSGGRRRQSFAPTSEEELNDATVWLCMEEKVESTLTSSEEETVEYLTNLTRALAEAPYYEDVTELHCVKKLKVDSSATTVEEKAKCTWMRQAQQLPGMSEAKARKLVEHYPSIMSLVEAYENPDLTFDEKKRLLEDKLVEGKKSKKLSESCYRLMTSNDPNELIA